MKKGIALITGANMTEGRVKFNGPDPAKLVKKGDTCFKMNAAAGTAAVLSQNGWHVIVTGYHQETLDLLAEEALTGPHLVTEVDLLERDQVQTLSEQVAATREEQGLDVHLVHYGGASDTDVELPGNSVFSDPWAAPGEAAPHLIANNCTTWLNILQGLRPVFDKQEMSKVVLISAITALRTKTEHVLDAIQKGGGHALARSLALDLTPQGIYVTEVMPGITDTGFYDNEHTASSIMRASADLGYDYGELENLPVFSAEKVGETVQFVLEADAHVREVSLMPYGQYPHLGA